MKRVILAFALVQLVAAGWDLPSPHSWENDGIAPRDLFGGLAVNLTPGEGHRYPLLHYAIVAVPSIVVLLPAVSSVDEWTVPKLKAAVLATGPMTGVSVVARLLAIVMACVTLLVIGRMTTRLFGERAGWFAVLALAVNLSFTFYARASNLDVPYLMWTVLALERLLDVLERGDVRDYAWFAFFVGCAVATKDQAYGTFVLVGPLFLIVWPLLGGPKPDGHWRRLAGALGVGALSLGVLGGGLLNPTGFLARIDMLTGTNSQDWRLYEQSLAGIGANLADLWRHQDEAFWPWPIVLMGWAGVGLAIPKGAKALLPAVGALSYLCFFVLVAARSEHRFMLPIGVLMTPYVGLACSRLPDVSWTRTALVALLIWAALPCGRLILTQWYDGRKAVEAWLVERPEGTVVETWGRTVYQPRYIGDGPYVVRRVGPSDPARRNPLVGATEVRGDPADYRSRGADVIVVAVSHGGNYADPDDVEARAYADRLDGYRQVMIADATPPFGIEPMRVHATAGVRTVVLERVE